MHWEPRTSSSQSANSVPPMSSRWPTRSFRGAIRVARGEGDGGLEELATSLELARQKSPDDPSEMAPTLIRTAWANLWLGRRDEARALFTEAMPHVEATPFTRPVDVQRARVLARRDGVGSPDPRTAATVASRQRNARRRRWEVRRCGSTVRRGRLSALRGRVASSARRPTRRRGPACGRELRSSRRR